MLAHDPVMSDLNRHLHDLDAVDALESRIDTRANELLTTVDGMLEATNELWDMDKHRYFGQLLVDLYMSKGSLNGAGLKLVALLEDACQSMAISDIEAEDRTVRLLAECDEEF